MHPDIRRPYTWTSKYTLYSVSIGELPALPDDYIEKIESILRPLGYEPTPQPDLGEHHNGGGDDSNPFQELNNLALRNLAAWVTDLNLYGCRRRVGRTASYEAVAAWRPSSTGRPLEQRKRNLQISGSRGIKDFGTGEGFSPINLVIRARGCERVDAVTWLQERLQPTNAPEVDFEALTHTQRADVCEPPPNHGLGSQEKAPPQYRFKLTPFWEMRPGIERPYLIDELIPAKGIVVVWGPPKCFKSFFVLDAMLHVAKGWEYHDRAVHQGTVVYCAFEGGHGYTKRIEALRRHYGLPGEDRTPMPIMSGMANLISDHKLLTKEIGAQLEGTMPAVVVLDTLNKSLQGSESKDTDMANYIRAAEAIREAFQCVVIIVHHCGWDESRMRGHSSLPGAVDAALAVTREGDIATVTVEFMRDGAEGTQVALKSKSLEVGEDANGRPLTSLVLERYDGDGAGPTAKKRDWPISLKVFRDSLVEATLNFGFDHQIESGPRVKAVDLNKVRDAFYQSYVAVSEATATVEERQNAKRMAFKRAVEKAQGLHLIGARAERDRQTVWLVTPFESGYAP